MRLFTLLIFLFFSSMAISSPTDRSDLFTPCTALFDEARSIYAESISNPNYVWNGFVDMLDNSWTVGFKYDHKVSVYNPVTRKYQNKTYHHFDYGCPNYIPIETCEENPDQTHCVLTCEENPDQTHCVLTCEENPNQSHCETEIEETCEENPNQSHCEDEEVDWSQVLRNQQDLLLIQDAMKNNQQALIDSTTSSLAISDEIIDNQQVVKTELISLGDLVSTKQTQIIDSLDLISNNIANEVNAIEQIEDTLDNNQNYIDNLINEPTPFTTEEYANNAVGLVESIGNQALEAELESFEDELKKDVDFLGAGGKDSPISEPATEHWGLKFDYIFPQSQQCSIEIPNPITGVMIPLDNQWSIFLKEILAWVISFYTFLALFEILFTPVAPKS